MIGSKIACGVKKTMDSKSSELSVLKEEDFCWKHQSMPNLVDVSHEWILWTEGFVVVVLSVRTAFIDGSTM
jgi:hypothetical protein